MASLYSRRQSEPAVAWVSASDHHDSHHSYSASTYPIRGRRSGKAVHVHRASMRSLDLLWRVSHEIANLISFTFRAAELVAGNPCAPHSHPAAAFASYRPL